MCQILDGQVAYFLRKRHNDDVMWATYKLARQLGWPVRAAISVAFAYRTNQQGRPLKNGKIKSKELSREDRVKVLTTKYDNIKSLGLGEASPSLFD